MTADSKKAFWVVGIVAATVSAATAAYLIWNRGRHLAVADTVEDLLDRCHDQVQRMEQRLGEITSAA